MPSPLALETICLTHAGRIRSYNEDSVAADGDAGLFAVADGMGGHRAGELASKLAIDAVLGELKRSLAAASPQRAGAVSEAMRSAFAKANQVILEQPRDDAALAGMGTTMVAAALSDRRVTIGHVGDSRAYLLRQGRLRLLTRDHSVLQHEIESGALDQEEARLSHNRNLVTRALGMGPDMEPDVGEESALPGDIFMLCSDGVNSMIDDADIELALASLASNLPLAARQLVMIANDNGGQDNVSVVLARVVERVAAQRGGLWARLPGWFRNE